MASQPPSPDTPLTAAAPSLSLLVVGAHGEREGLVPVHVPGAPGRLGVQPSADERLALAVGGEVELRLQLGCALSWEGGRVAAVQAQTARVLLVSRKGGEAPKLRFVYTWGSATQARGATQPLADLAGWRLSVGSQGEEPLASGAATRLPVGGALHAWVKDRLNHQRDDGLLEHLAGWLHHARRPERVDVALLPVVCLAADTLDLGAGLVARAWSDEALSACSCGLERRA